MRTENRAYRLHQYQADAPGGQQGFQRPPIQPADHRALQRDTNCRGDDEGGWQSHDQIGVNCAGQEFPEQELTHIGGVRANHQQFAVRHVDDAHQAEGNRQAERRQQQHTAERDAVKQIADKLSTLQPTVDFAQRGHHRDPHRLVRFDIAAIGIFFEHSLQQRLQVGVGTPGQADHSGFAQRGVRRLQVGGRDQQLQNRFNIGVVFFFKCLTDQRYLCRVNGFLKFECSCHAQLAVLREQF